MLVVPALQLSHPMLLFVLMEPDDALLHGCSRCLTRLGINPFFKAASGVDSSLVVQEFHWVRAARRIACIEPRSRIARQCAQTSALPACSPFHQLEEVSQEASGSWQTTSMLCPSGPMTKAA
jgi:hypothetical protein